MPRNPEEILVHCLAVRPDWMQGTTVQQKVEEVRLWHKRDRKWRDIGYAAILDRDGSLGKGRDLNKDGSVWDDVGAHAKGRNRKAIGIALVGGIFEDGSASENDQFYDHFTVAQDIALRQLIAELKAKFPTIKRVRGHNDYAAKACPSFNVQKWLARKPEAIATAQPSPKGKARPDIQAVLDNQTPVPILLIGAAVAALVAGFVFLRKKVFG